MSNQYAIERLTLLLDQIQSLHAEARAISEEYSIPFDLELEGGRNYNTVAEYEPNNSWSFSNC